jgi:hypothetical protein
MVDRVLTTVADRLDEAVVVVSGKLGANPKFELRFDLVG